MAKDDVPWLLRLLYDFPYAMDLVDDNGFPDHDKLLPAMAAIAFIWFIFLHPDPSTHAILAWIVVGGYIYGFAAWRSVLDATKDRIRGTLGNADPDTEQRPTEPAPPEA